MLLELLRAFCSSCFCPLADDSNADEKKEPHSIQQRRSRTVKAILINGSPSLYLHTASPHHHSCRSIQGILKPPSPALTRKADGIVRAASPCSALSVQSFARNSSTYKHVSWADLPEEEGANPVATFMKRSRSRSSERHHDSRYCSEEQKANGSLLPEESSSSRDALPSAQTVHGQLRREIPSSRQRPESLCLSRSNYRMPGMQAAEQDSRVEMGKLLKAQVTLQNHLGAAGRRGSKTIVTCQQHLNFDQRRTRSLDVVMDTSRTSSEDGEGEGLQDETSSLASPRSIDINELNLALRRIVDKQVFVPRSRFLHAGTSDRLLVLSGPQKVQRLVANGAGKVVTTAVKSVGKASSSRPQSWPGTI